MASFNSLPNSVIIKILGYLSYKDIVSVGSTNSRLRGLATYDYLWRKPCQDEWLITATQPTACGENSWKELFVSNYKKFGKYFEHYRKIKSLWNALEAYLTVHSPEIHRTLNAGLEEEVLTRFEHENDVVLPDDYKMSYLLHNGQNCDAPGLLGLFGGLFLPNESYFCSGLCTFESAIDSYSAQCKYALPITSTQSLKLVVSQLVLPTEATGTSAPHGTELIAFCDGRYCSVSDSFSEWFSSFVEKLTNGHYPIVEGNILLYDKDTEVRETTQFVTVTVRWSYNHAFNNEASTSDLYTYHITMSMAGDAPSTKSCKLLTRHWEIFDESGHSQVVDGEGVVGYYPVMKPGAVFTWRSYTTFRTPEGGSMKGHFTMQYLSNPGLLLNVACPEFKMKRPPALDPKWTES